LDNLKANLQLSK